MPRSKNRQYVARLCWNRFGWVRPSGDAPHLESGTYATKSGFGHEEWLFNFSWLVDGYHYGFIQPIHNAYKRVGGTCIEVLLYSIRPDKQRVYVGRIRNCEVISDVQAAKARDFYRRKGWIASMAKQVKQVEGDERHIQNARNPRTLFNVRFKLGDAEIYDPYRIARTSDAVWSRPRYNLTKAGKRALAQWKRKGSNAPPNFDEVITRKGTPATSYDPFHTRLQAALMKQLQHLYGKANVLREHNNVDLTVKERGSTTLIEIKTTPIAKAAIREAIGQLLEYAYFEAAPSRSLKLVIVAPGLFDDAAAKYIERLRKEFCIPISYCSYAEGDPLPAVFAKRAAARR